jgi:hypothetical protein
LASCHYPNCKEPHGKDAYVYIESLSTLFCLYCFLVHAAKMDEEDAFQIEEEATQLVYNNKVP